MSYGNEIHVRGRFFKSFLLMYLETRQKHPGRVSTIFRTERAEALKLLLTAAIRERYTTSCLRAAVAVRSQRIDIAAEREQTTNKMVNVMNGNGTEFFPPCTSDVCTVDEAEKERVAAAAAAKPACEVRERCVESCAAYGKVCPCAARIAAHAACDAMHELRLDSHIFQQAFVEGKPNFPYIRAEDIVIGEKLGEGGFSNVNLCVVTVGEEAGQQFAVKYLKRRAMVDLHQFKHGAADLAVEALYVAFALGC